MKNRVLSTALKSAGIVLMLLSALALAFPLMHHIEEKLYALEEYALNLIEEEAGITVSYETLSPAILTGIKLTGITVSDADNGTVLLQLKSVNIGYHLMSLIRMDLENAVQSISISGLQFHFNDRNNMKVVQKLMGLLETEGEGKDDDAAGSIELPFPIRIDDASFTIEALDASLSLKLDSLTLKNTVNPSRLSIQTGGHLSLIPDATLTQIIPELKTDIKIQALVNPELDGTCGRFELTGTDGGTFAFKDISFLAGFEEDEVTLTVFTDGMPYDFSAALNIADGSIHAEFNAEDFDPFDLVQLKTLNPFVKRIKGGRIDGSFTLDACIPESATGQAGSGDGTGGSGIAGLLSGAGSEGGSGLLTQTAVTAADNADGTAVAAPSAASTTVDGQKGAGASKSGGLLNGVLDGLDEFEKYSIRYDVDGTVYLPPSALGPLLGKETPLSVRLDADGTLRRIQVTQLEVETVPVEARFVGTANLTALSLSGYLDLTHLELPNGTCVSGEFYIQDLERGFSAFSPQFLLGERTLTAMELELVPGTDSADFRIEAYDYSHLEADDPGHVVLEGSILVSGDKPFIQAGASFENTFIDSLVRYGQSALNDSLGIDADTLMNLEPYILSCDLYVTSDLSSMSFNMPYAIVANTRKDGEMLLLSLDGNETTLQISQFELLYGGYGLSAVIDLDATEDYSQIFFTTDFTYNSLPYSLSGMFAPGRTLVLNGDYGFEAVVDLGLKNSFICSLSTDNLPFMLQDYLVALSVQTQIEFTDLNDFKILIEKLEVSENSGKLRTDPRVELSGFADRYGLVLDTISYGDSISLLTGSGTVSWNLTQNGFIAAECQSEIQNAFTGETVRLDLSVTNPEETPFSSPDFMKSVYVSGSADVLSLPMSRFVDRQTTDDTVTIHASVLGQLSNPFVTVDVPRITMHIDSNPLIAGGMFMLDDRMLSCSGLSLHFEPYTVEDFGFELSLDEMTGTGNGTVSVNMAPLFTGKTPVTFSMDISQPDGGLPSLDKLNELCWKAMFNLEKIDSNYDIQIENYGLSVEHADGLLYFTAGTNGGITGYLLDTGDFYFSCVDDFPISFNADGSARNGQMDIEVHDIAGNLATFTPLIPPLFTLRDGPFSGRIHVGGKLADPEFEGEIVLSNFDAGFDQYLDAPVTAEAITLTALQNKFTVQDAVFQIGKASVLVNADIEMDRWDVGSIDVNIKTEDGTMIPAHANIPFADCTAEGAVNMNVNIKGDEIYVGGSISISNPVVEFHAPTDNDVEQTPNSQSDLHLIMDLNVAISQKAQLYYPNKENPLIRGLVTTQQPVNIYINTDSSEFTMKGELSLRGGEILYLNRNFYIREGTVTLDESSESFDPRISFRAEIRERDAENEVIKIILSADRQRLSQLDPRLTSEPSRTETELRLLLGEALLAESGASPGEVLASVAASGFDFLIQNSLFRQLENRLRDLCNFDIFSFRTPFIQQALLQAMNNSEDQKSLGNYFDNTTVYIGKYIGNSIYLDALLRFVYQEDGVGETIQRRLALQPEIGLELPSPFATIRWSIAPDMTSARNLWVPSTSISLSWSFKF